MHEAADRGKKVRHVRNMLDHFERQDDVEPPAFGQEVLRQRVAIAHGRGTERGMALRDLDVAFGCVDTQNIGAQA